MSKVLFDRLVAECKRFLQEHDDYMADPNQTWPGDICHEHVSNLNKILNTGKTSVYDDVYDE